MSCLLAGGTGPQNREQQLQERTSLSLLTCRVPAGLPVLQSGSEVALLSRRSPAQPLAASRTQAEPHP